ncbi:unnamed protein product [Triticum turgidum subsp. durum]|uniref:Uncharacterized protein n=1 Tax=Triticum turgidum subsp. durum TaxID=4567 RepID=A0A9R1QT45_TRITD|nr:unnamed protein product [Triticum turgidum subsp. durum]
MLSWCLVATATTDLQSNRLVISRQLALLVMAARYDNVNNYEEKMPHAKTVHPSPEHFYPPHVALGAIGDKPKAELIHHSWAEANMSYASYHFTTKD